MTAFRATFLAELVDGPALDAEFVRTTLEEALEEIEALFVMDDDDHESEYSVSVGVVEVVT